MTVSTITASVDETDRRDFAAVRSQDPFYSPENQAYVLKSVKELREGRGHVHELIEV